MVNGNERPICHRAEDLVTYLYGEATTEEAHDFTAHMQQCDACRAEFNVFNQVHESIVTWRNEALGSIASAAAQEEVPIVNAEPLQHGRRRLPALAALREFFTVSPVWLRGATAFAGLLLCALLIFAAWRLWRQPTANGNEAKHSEEQFQQAVERRVAEEVAKLNQTQGQGAMPPNQHENSVPPPPRAEVAAERNRPHAQRRNRLTREERVQLAADLGLIQGREEEMPFVLPDEPNQ